MCCALATPAFAQDEPPVSEEPSDSLREPLPAETDATAAKLFATSVQAAGGEALLRNIETMKADLTLSRGPYDTDMKLYVKRPNKVRTEVSERHMGREYMIYTGYNGETGWVQDFSDKKGIPKKLGGKEAEELKGLAFDDILLDWEVMGCKLAYLGPVNSRKEKNFLVKLYYPDGQTEYFYFHPKTYLLTRRGKKEQVSDIIVDVDVYLTKYKQINGVWFPVESEVSFGGEPVMQMKFDDVQLNVPVSDSIFEMPAIDEVWLRSNKAR